MTPEYSESTDEALLQLVRELRERNYHFTTVTPATHERVNSRSCNEWAQTIKDIFGWSRPFYADTVSPAIFELMQRAGVLQPHTDGWRSTVRVSSLYEQLFLHSAYPTTAADSVFFGPDTYRFAGAIQHWLELNPRSIGRAVDICCGAGPGGILIALAQPDAQVFGADINDAALRLAGINAQLSGVQNFEPRHSDLLTGVDGDFDLIVANPPYLIDPSERAYRHGGGELGEGLSFDIVEASLPRLAPGGTLLLYTGVAIVEGKDPFRAAIEKRLAGQAVEYSYREVDPDVFGEELESGAYAHCDRIAAVVLTVRRKSSSLP